MITDISTSPSNSLKISLLLLYLKDRCHGKFIFRHEIFFSLLGDSKLL